MSTFFAMFKDYRRTTTILFWYWLLSAVAYLLYQTAVSAQTGMSFEEVITDPGVALAFVASCSVIIMAALLRVAEAENLRTLRIYAIFSVVHQLLTGNIIGLILAALIVYYMPPAKDESFAPTQKLILIGGMVLIGLVLVLWLVAQLNRMLGG
ncbi:hypothetical protein [Corynebacterium sp. TAE3-ERU30]|uniref:hypothetical protein n=1 Tax=Corynebacterium sp. TAE3-ERU30 TaxID=2849496 RepID=UPI001C46DF98|nr:hypothetical protein [Corynebacterium sp. TAE3-ERU30]MBV7280894.1 hypothetical protein [Corynebacterium sp. TAE3-ERU30]